MDVRAAASTWHAHVAAPAARTVLGPPAPQGRSDCNALKRRPNCVRACVCAYSCSWRTGHMTPSASQDPRTYHRRRLAPPVCTQPSHLPHHTTCVRPLLLLTHLSPYNTCICNTDGTRAPPHYYNRSTMSNHNYETIMLTLRQVFTREVGGVGSTCGAAVRCVRPGAKQRKSTGTTLSVQLMGG